MKTFFFVAAWLVLVGSAIGQTAPPKIAATAIPEGPQLPAGWSKSGLTPQDYELFRDPAVHHSGKASGSIRSKVSTEGFATMMQSIKPDTYRRKRIRLSGYLRSENVSGGAALWVRVDSSEPNVSLSFDNMGNRSVNGTT